MRLDDYLGNGRLAIQVGADAPVPDQLAAEELSTHLEAISGVAIPIISPGDQPEGLRLLVGEAALADSAEPLAEDEIHLKAGEGHYIIRGGGQRGTLYAVYELLEALGVRWFHPEETFIPELSTIELPREIRRRPSFDYREAHWYTAYSDTTFAARLRYNGSMAKVPIRLGGHWGWQPYVHSFFTAVPPETYAAKHPEYYSYRRGQGRVVQGGQLCLSNPEVIDRLTAFALEQMAEPLVRIVDLSQMDHANPCECPDCAAIDEAAGSPSGSIIAMCNEVASRTTQVYPDKFIGTLAYTYTLKPPQGMQAHPNVLVRLCHMNGCETHPLDGCERNRAFLEILHAWQQVSKRIYVWDYVTNFQHALCFQPNFVALRADIQLLREAGVSGLFLQGFAQKGVVFEELHSYAMGRCLWDASRDYYAEVRDFLCAYYGAAAGPHLWEMIQVLQEGRAADFHLHLYRHPHQGTFQPEQLRRAQGCLDRAIAAVGEQEPHRRRLDQVALWMDFTCMATTSPVSVGEEVLHIEAADEEAPQRYQRVCQALKRFGITTICEYPTSMNDLETAWKWSVKTRDLPLTRLADEHLELALSPELNGMICSLRDTRTGIDLLGKPEPEILHYPYVAGIVECLGLPTGVAALHAFDSWRLMETSDTEATMSIVIDPALRMERRVSLLPGRPGLVLQSVITNLGDQPLAVSPHLFVILRAGRLDDIHFFKVTSEGACQRLHNGMRSGADQEQWVSLSGEEVPDRRWGFFNPVLGLGLAEEVDRPLAFCGSNGHLDTGHVLAESKLSSETLAPGAQLVASRRFEVLHDQPW